jgi:hypothetical protein
MSTGIHDLVLCVTVSVHKLQSLLFSLARPSLAVAKDCDLLIQSAVLTCNKQTIIERHEYGAKT